MSFFKSIAAPIAAVGAICGVIAVTAASAGAEIVTCPQDGRPYDTSHGYYVDVPNTEYYVPEGQR